MLRDKLDEARVFLQMAEEEGRDDSEAARETQSALDASQGARSIRLGSPT